jgi:hypothetical protein
MGKNNSKLNSSGNSQGSGGSSSVGPPPEQVCFDDFEVLRAIGRGSFGKVTILI